MVIPCYFGLQHRFFSNFPFYRWKKKLMFDINSNYFATEETGWFLCCKYCNSESPRNCWKKRTKTKQPILLKVQFSLRSAVGKNWSRSPTLPHCLLFATYMRHRKPEKPTVIFFQDLTVGRNLQEIEQRWKNHDASPHYKIDDVLLISVGAIHIIPDQIPKRFANVSGFPGSIAEKDYCKWILLHFKSWSLSIQGLTHPL